MRTCNHGKLLTETCDACDKLDQLYDRWYVEMVEFRRINEQLSSQNIRLQSLLFQALVTMKRLEPQLVFADDSAISLIDDIETFFSLRGGKDGSPLLD